MEESLVDRAGIFTVFDAMLCAVEERKRACMDA